MAGDSRTQAVVMATATVPSHVHRRGRQRGAGRHRRLARPAALQGHHAPDLRRVDGLARQAVAAARPVAPRTGIFVGMSVGAAAGSLLFAQWGWMAVTAFATAAAVAALAVRWQRAAGPMRA
ncbi:hypothetical protein [Pseudorhodoferax soli]